MTRVIAGAAVGILAAGVPAGHASAAPRPGRVLLEEPFTGASADARFVGYGSACLTGARRGQAQKEAANHPLGGCRRDPAGPVPPGDGAPYGYLQLTDAHPEETGAVLFDSPIPARNGLEVTFEQWQYGNTTRLPADGLSFFLTDGSGRLTTPGAFGGSLGYAQKLPDDRSDGNVVPGVSGGYLGFGFDVLGDYFGDGEQRGEGCEQRSPAGTELRPPAPGPNMVSVRGPGDGAEGYCLLGASTGNRTATGPWPSSLPGSLHGELDKLPADATPRRAADALEPVKRTVRIVVPSKPDSAATVDIDFQDGRGFRRVLRFSTPENVPSTYKFGFAASTGPLTDVHLIRRVALRSLPTPSGRQPKKYTRG
ncbi:hypothetical protein [Actinomadura fibrosa]|uniref:Uncharacterized protein n=1 Tax=Actinomadura fibrosa TaxID=111802 RepID=A0ABW2Y1B8_9ACTN|nr:hypothetical protein [Actinomadura fibrosa]